MASVEKRAAPKGRDLGQDLQLASRVWQFAAAEPVKNRLLAFGTEGRVMLFFVTRSDVPASSVARLLIAVL